jgi:hypothetical protein
MQRLCSPAVATGGNCWQMARRRNRLKSEKRHILDFSGVNEVNTHKFRLKGAHDPVRGFKTRFMPRPGIRG